jgi:CheY-like chemotaxis protein
MNIGSPKKTDRTILVVDDNEVVIKAISLKLQGAGYRVITAMNDEEVTLALRDPGPDLILLDVSFPPEIAGAPWDGFRILETIQRLDPEKKIPIIIITGHEDAKAKERAANVGAIALFPKPLEYDYLLKAIRATLGEPVVA